MYKSKRVTMLIVSSAAMIILLLVLCIGLIPPIKASLPYSDFYAFAVVCLVTLSLVIVTRNIRELLLEKLQRKTTREGETSIISEFIEKLRVCYSNDDFFETISSVLEQKGDCSVLYVDRRNNYILYNSPDRLTTSKETMATLELNYNQNWKDGIFFMGENMGIVSSPKNARGFFLVNEKHHLYVFCRYIRLFDEIIYSGLFDEYKRFQRRSNTISDLSEIASLSKEWQLLADTQKSFLPQKMPDTAGLEIATYFRPLVNVSGDYYSVLPIDEHKTLLMLGDVSGKGLAAALVMGLVMNTVKILENKTDLPAMIRAVDKAIKGMKLQDKYTVLFLGIVDTQKMKITYVNASMSDPLIISRSATGYKIKPLTSNCSLVGIIDLGDISVDEHQLYRGDVILMASDGVSEVMDEHGVELGTTSLYEETIKKSAAKHPKEFVDDVVNLIMDYNGGKKLRDDVTMMVCKVQR